jgi:23S rRNA (cytosine1962-C5)-methyltransferase
MKTIRLKEGKERSLLRRHPWIFDSAVARGGADAGETVRVESHAGDFLAWAAFSPTSRIRARAWSFDEQQRIDAAFLGTLIERAVRTRELFDIRSDGVRLIHGESDGLPGLIVDRYADTLVAQFTSCGVERWKGVIADALLRTTGLSRLYERSDARVRTLEGLPEATGWLRGDGPTELGIREHDWRLTLDIATGHKTGFYLDQRDSRARFARTLRQLGAFSACSTAIATPAASRWRRWPVGRRCDLDRLVGAGAGAGQRPCGAQWLRGGAHDFLDADVNASLRAFIEAGRSFDAIVLDPPKFAPSAAHAERAARAYKDINRLAFKLLEPGGELFTYSCSGGISADLFHKIVASAGIDAGVEGCISEAAAGCARPPDDPVHFPEGEYLKGLVVVKKPL